MSVLEWANLPNSESDYMVHKLVNKSFGETVSETDLIIAKELVRQRFVVGLMEEMEESIRRFNVALGVDGEDERNRECMVEFFGEKHEEDEDVEDAANGVGEEKTLANTDNKNSNHHPKVSIGVVCNHPRRKVLIYTSPHLSIIRIITYNRSLIKTVPNTRPSQNAIPSI